MRAVLFLFLLLSSSVTFAAIFVVDTTSGLDTAALQACTDEAPDDCSLRGALTRAQNAVLAPGDDDIHFDIPLSDPGCDAATGVCTITLPVDVTASTNTAAQGGLTLDGYTQPGASPNSLPVGQGSNAVLKIELAGSSLSFAAPVTVRGIAFRNALTLFKIGGLCCSPPVPPRLEVEGNFFGLRADGVTPTPSPPNILFSTSTSVGNIDGVRIGGADPAQMNVFGSSANASAAGECLRLSGTNHIVLGNLIGTDRSGLQARGCLTGLLVSSTTGLQIGGSAAGQGNVISGHFNRAFQIQGSAPPNFNVLIQGNRIGVGVDGATPVPNAVNGVFAGLPVIRGDNGASAVRIGGTGPGEGNLIAFNGFGRPPSPSTPPFVDSPVTEFNGRWEILGNRMVGNEGIGMKLSSGGLVRLVNDAGDDDASTGGKLQNFPVISAVSLSGDQLQLTYKVDSTFNASPAAGQSMYPLTVEFYRADFASGSDLLGRDVYTSDQAQQDKTITLTLPAGLTLDPEEVIVATATDAPVPGAHATGNTSEFSFYPLESFSLISLTPSTVPAGVPYVARVRLVSASGVPFKPNGRALIDDGRGNQCTAVIQPVAAARTGEGECQLVTTGTLGNLNVRGSYSAALNAFALPNGFHPTNQVLTLSLTAGISTLELVSGDGQSAEVGLAFANPLLVRALGSGGAPVAGVQLRFESPSSGPGASFNPVTVITNADGFASATATAIRAGGSYTVTARVGGLTQDFALTNEPGFDTALQIVSHLPNPSFTAQAVTVTTALNPEAGGPLPTGAIAVSANTGEACNIVLPGTSCQIAFATLGERVIQAFYPGDASYRSSKAAFVNQTVQPAPSLRIDDVSQNEGNSGSTDFVFTVTLDNALGGAVSVNFATADDTAEEPGDYAANSGTLNFSGATTTQTITVAVVGDTVVEPDERFFVNLSNASGAVIADAQGIGTILNDDEPPPPVASIDDVTVQEPVSGEFSEVLAQFTVSLDRPASTPVSVRVRTVSGSATAGLDFDANDFVLSFAPGEREQPVLVFIREDAIVEPTETFTVELSDPQGLVIGDGIGLGTILDAAFDGTLVVNSSGDPGNGACNLSECTLREAILLGNTLAAASIRFDIPGSSVHTIRPQTPLPVLGASILSIDGYSQPGSSVNTRRTRGPDAEEQGLDNVVRIELDGSLLGSGSNGLIVTHGSSLRGLAIGGFPAAGIRVVVGSMQRPALIHGNLLGTDASGTLARGNGSGIELVLSGPGFGRVPVSIGGFDPAMRNVISGNLGDGIRILDNFAPLGELHLIGNLVGVGRHGLALGNGGHGLQLLASSADQAPALISRSNQFGANAGSGMLLRSQAPAAGTPRGRIDSDSERFDPPNALHGVQIGDASSSLRNVRMGGSSFADGPAAAIRVLGEQSRAALSPSLLPLQAAPIDLGPLGPTANDPGDGDSGPNELLNHPLLLAAEYNDRGDRLRITAELDIPVQSGQPLLSVYRRADSELLLIGVGSLEATGSGFAGSFELAARGTRIGEEIYAQATYGGVSSELSVTPVPVSGRQALASAAPVREATGAQAQLTIALDAEVIAPVTLRVRTIDGSARAGLDYQAVDTQLTLTSAAPTAQVLIGILNDALVEQDEIFQVEVFSESNFGIGTALALVTIIDDDRVRRDRSQFSPMDLDGLDGRDGFRISHPRSAVVGLIDVGDFNGSAGKELLLGSGEAAWLIADLAPPFAPFFHIELPALGSVTFPRIVGSQPLQPRALGQFRGPGFPAFSVEAASGGAWIRGRSTPLAASTPLNTLLLAPDGGSIASGSPPYALIPVGDVNGDGLPDVILQDRHPQTCVIFGSAGALPSSVPPVNPGAGFCLSASGVGLGVIGIGDIDGDGRDELLVSFGNLIAGTNVTQHVVLAGRSSWPALIQLPGDGTAFASLPPSIRALAGDFNGDGHGDLLVASNEASFLKFGNGSIGGIVDPSGRTTIAGLGRDGIKIVLSDFDGNGISDLLLKPSAGRDLLIVFGRRQWPAQIDLLDPPLLGTRRLTSQQAMGSAHALGDFNGDGLDDLSVSTAEQSYVLFSSDAMFGGSAEAQQPEPMPETVFASIGQPPAELDLAGASFRPIDLLPAGDVDGDGKPDLLVSELGNVDSPLALLPGNALALAGSLNLRQLPDGATRIRRDPGSTGAVAIGVAAACDFDGDGRADLAFLSSNGDQLALVRGRTGGLPAFLDPFQASSLVRTIAFPGGGVLSVRCLGDVDGDGFDDLAVVSGGMATREVEVVYGLAGTGNPARTRITAPASMQPLSLARVPGLQALRGGSIRSFSVALGNGGHALLFSLAGRPAELSLAAPGGVPVSILRAAHWRAPGDALLAGIGDFDGDGMADLAIAHRPPSSDGRPLGRVELLRGRVSWPANIDPGSHDSTVVQGRIQFRGESSDELLATGLAGLADRNGDGRRELLVSFGLAEDSLLARGRAMIVHGFALPVGQQSVREIERRVPPGDGLTLENRRILEALARGVALGDLDGDGREELVFGSAGDDGSTPVVHLIRGSALPQ